MNPIIPEERLAAIRHLRVVLIYLPHPYLKQPDAQAPIGILYLAALLEEAGIEVQVRNYSTSHTWDALADLPAADFYGISVTSLELMQANRFAHLIKEKFGNCAVTLGGPGTYCEEFIDWGVIDSICKGDGEEALFLMLEDHAQKKLQRVYQLPPYRHIDSLPFPARHLLGSQQGGNIFAYNARYKPGDSTVLVTSRGCPFHCAFCSSPFFTNNKVRFRDPQKVFQEVKQVKTDFGIQQFRISDDMFMANPQRVLALCDLLEPLEIVWRISTRVKPLDEYVYRRMFETGCREVSFGVESFDNNVLRVLKKETTAEDNARALELASRIGIRTRVLFMIRTPGQTSTTVPENIRWLERVPYDIICCTSFVPIPGSDIWLNPEAYDIEILNRNLDDYNFYFFGSRGENEMKDIIKIKDRPLDVFNQESQDFRDYLLGTGKLNVG